MDHITRKIGWEKVFVEDFSTVCMYTKCTSACANIVHWMLFCNNGA